MNRKHPYTRRTFLKTAATAGAVFTIVPRHVLGGPRFVPPSERVNIALIGAGGMGFANLGRLLQLDDAQVVAVADPAASYSAPRAAKKLGGRQPAKTEVEKDSAAKGRNHRCADYEDFRVMLEKEKSIDAVLCATPDHLHAYVSVWAMRAGKHVYCEKPLTHNLWEARLVSRVARETGVATQLGNQGHANVGIRETIEHLQAGTIGTVREFHAWVVGTRWNPTLTGLPTETPPVPAGLNWDLWLGPRAARPYHPAYCPVSWRDFWAFGGSAIGDFACHDLDAALWAFNLPTPSRVEAHGTSPMDAEIGPHGAIIHYDFPAHKEHPSRRLTWYQGGLRPRTPEALGKFRLPARGGLFIGDKGAIQCDGAGGAPRLFPESLRDPGLKPKPTLARSPGHHREWLDACKGGAPAGSNFAYGARLTELALLGVLALRSRKPIEWDPENLKARGVPEADAIIRGSYRQGWEIA